VAVLVVVATIMARSDIWFVKTPVQIARTMYGADPLPESEVIAQSIYNNSGPDARVVVLGSEPEVYFLAHRHSATGCIYTCAQTEPQPFALKMQHEMISDIETRKPEFVVFADNIMSWNRRPDSDPEIFNWWDSYQTHYTLVGMADIISPTQTIYALGVKWVARYGKDIQGSGLEVYQRKTAVNNP
jgi:hypothetical protein